MGTRGGRALGWLPVIAVLACGMATAAGEDMASIMPPDSIAYVRLENLDKIHSALVESGLKAELLALIQAQEPELAADAEAVARIVGQLRSLHVCVRDWAVYRNFSLQAVLIADVGQRVELDRWLPPSLAGMLAETDPHAGVRFHEIRSQELERERMEILLAVVDGYVIVSTDRFLMEDVVDAMLAGRERSLAADPDYRAAMADQVGHDMVAYVSGPRLMSAIDGSLDRRDLRDWRAIVEVLGLKHIRSVACAADYEGGAATLRLLVDTDNRAYRIIAQPAVAPRAPRVVPRRSVFSLSTNIGDAPETWAAINDYLSTVLLRIGEVRSRDDYRRNLAEGEQFFGVSFDEVAALVDGEIGFFFDNHPERGIDDDEVCIFAFVRDVPKAKAMMRAFEASAFGNDQQRETENVGGVTLTTVGGRGGLAWAIVDGCLLFGPSADAVRAAIQDIQAQTPLAAHEGFRSVAQQLHPTSAWLAYLDAGALVRLVLEKEMGVPPMMTDLFGTMTLAATVRVQDGAIEVRAVDNAEVSLLDVFSAIRNMLRAFGPQPPVGG